MFIEERMSTCIDYGSSFSSSFAVKEVSVANGNSYQSLRHPYPTLRFDLGFANRLTDDQIDALLDLYNRVGGRFGGFRLKHHAEFTTAADYRGAPAFNDQEAILVSTGVYQLVRWYGTEGDTTATRRRIRKPVAGTVLAGIRNVITGDHAITGFTVDTTTGLITLAADEADTITAITRAAQAVLTVGAHTYSIGESVYISGVVGMTQINGRRGTITATGATTITVNIDSTAFSAYTSGGATNTRPQGTETVVAGCEFDIPVRFENDLDGVNYSNLDTLSAAVSLIEKLNP